MFAHHLPDPETLSHEAPSPLRLTSAALEADFDCHTGALIGLRHPATGWTIVARSALGESFSMLVPLPDRANHRVTGSRQRLQSHSLSADGGTLTLTWNGVVSDQGLHLDVTFVGIVAIRAGGLEFSGRVVNRSGLEIETVAWPCLGELRPPRPDSELVRYSPNHCALETFPLYPTFQNQQGYWGSDVPLQKAYTPHNPFNLVLAADQGLYLGHHQTEANELLGFQFELHPGYAIGTGGFVPEGDEIGGRPVHLRFLADHFVFAAPGQTRELPPFAVHAFTGTWHRGMDIRRAWRKAWAHAAPVPQWLHEVHSWTQIQINSIAGERRCRYADLIAHGRLCVQHGVEAIQLTGWTVGGQDGRLPSHATEPLLGTWEELRDAITALQALGLKVVLYEKMIYADVDTDSYRRELHAYMSRDRMGNVEGHSGWAYFLPSHFAGFNKRRLNWSCMHHPGWQNTWLSEFSRSLELGADGVLLDESCHERGDGRFCFASDHGHAVPAYNCSGDSSLLARMRTIADRQPRPQLFAAEASNDLQTVEYGLSYFRLRPGHIPYLRYLEPFYPMQVAVVGFDDREQLNLCLLYRYLISYEPFNFKGRLDDFPLTVAYGQKVDAFRRRHRRKLWDAEFQDTQGAAVTALEGGTQPLHSVFRDADSGLLSAVIANHSRRSAVRVAVTFTGPPRRIESASPESPEPAPVAGAIEIPPRSVVAVFQTAD